MSRLLACIKPNSIPKSIHRCFCTTQSHQPTTSYDESDYSWFFGDSGIDENQRLEHNLCSTLSWFSNSMTDYVVSKVVPIPEEERINKRVLDIACGTGHYAYRMFNLGFNDITGIDICTRSLHYARNVLCKDILSDNLKFQTLNARELLDKSEYHNQFDIINAQWLFCHAMCRNDIKIFSNAISKCLKKDGILTGMDWSPNQRGSIQDEWLQFGIFLFNDKYENYKPTDGEFCRSRFGMEGGGRVLPVLKPGETSEDLLEFMDGIRVDYGEQIDLYWWKQETLRKCLEEAGFRNIRFEDPSIWDIENKDSNTLNENEKYAFKQYLKMDNVGMCGFKASKL